MDWPVPGFSGGQGTADSDVAVCTPSAGVGSHEIAYELDASLASSNYCRYATLYDVSGRDYDSKEYNEDRLEAFIFKKLLRVTPIRGMIEWVSERPSKNAARQSYAKLLILVEKDVE